jgi:hypothetical protein
MRLTVEGRGLTDDRVDAMKAGLSAMGQAEATVVVTDGFVDTVRRLTSQAEYSTARGSGEVAARTVHVNDKSTVIVNAAVVRSRPTTDIERLLAHEAGHIQLNEREEGLEGRRNLVSAEWAWLLLCIGSLAMDEWRIERSLGGLGYPIAEWATIPSAELALHQLNVEVMEALLDPANGADPKRLSEAVARTHDWYSKHLAYFAAWFHLVRTGSAGFSARGKQNWDDYVGATWPGWLGLYEAVPTSFESINETNLNDLLRQAGKQEAALLSKIGFRYSTQGNSYSFKRVITDAHCAMRVQRASS